MGSEEGSVLSLPVHMESQTLPRLLSSGNGVMAHVREDGEGAESVLSTALHP